ncbi:MAG: hypothetical protein OYG31_01885 [Candidatus Kaiserbacteria bacterium]|nr:hypothetical protein [Candidatus Kaiserbacteria bacterium]
MRLSNTSTETFFEKARKTACLYGFRPLHEFVEEHKKTPKKANVVTYNQTDRQDLKNLSYFLKFCFERSLHMGNDPIFVFHSNVDKETQSLFPRTRKLTESRFTLTIVGIAEPFAEALVLSCANHILRSLKVKNATVRINSMGTQDDSKEYFTKLNRTLRRFRDTIHPECRHLVDRAQVVEAHPFLYNENHQKVSEHITQTLRILSDSARHHFERVIEYLEAHELQYKFAPELVETTRHGIHTIFDITDDDSCLRATGGRYDTFSYTMYRRKVPIISISITMPEKTSPTYTPTSTIKKPSIFFFHAGEKARLKSLFTLSRLCEANIPVTQRLHHTRVADQLTDLARLYPYTLVFGQEEVERDAVCIRRNDTRASQIIPLNGPFVRTIREFIRK